MPGMRFSSLLILFLAAGAGASDLPRCVPPREGAVACLDGKLCECRYDPGGSLSGRPAGLRWNCGALRPACGAAAAAPVDAGPPQQPPPVLPMPLPQGWR